MNEAVRKTREPLIEGPRAYGIPTQPFLTIVPLNGQMQLSTGITWQFAVTLFPELSMAVQRVQTKAAIARSGVSSNTTLKSMAAELVSKSIFFFMLKFLPFCPDE